MHVHRDATASVKIERTGPSSAVLTVENTLLRSQVRVELSFHDAFNMASKIHEMIQKFAQEEMFGRRHG